MTKVEFAHPEDAVTLPPDGAFIEVSPWRRQLGWILTVVFGSMALFAMGKVLQKGDVAAIPIALYQLIIAGLAVRLPLCGLLLEQSGVKLRTLVWTHRWSWGEIDRFELKERGYIPRLRVHLSNGKVKRAPGFLARSTSQEERCQALFKALQERLEAEKRRLSDPMSAV